MVLAGFSQHHNNNNHRFHFHDWQWPNCYSRHIDRRTNSRPTLLSTRTRRTTKLKRENANRNSERTNNDPHQRPTAEWTWKKNTTIGTLVIDRVRSICRTQAHRKLWWVRPCFVLVCTVAQDVLKRITGKTKDDSETETYMCNRKSWRNTDALRRERTQMTETRTKSVNGN